MLEQLILLGFGVASICGFISLASLIVWAWEKWDKRKERKARRFNTLQAPRRKTVEDYWKGAA